MAMTSVRALAAVTLALTFAACGTSSDRPKDPPAVASAAPADSPVSPPKPTPETVGETANPPEEDKEEYVPAEFKSGADRWRDTGVYVDGKFVGLLAWAELPLGLPVHWVQVKASAPKRYGTSDTGWRMAKERRYLFTDYLRALGLDLAKVREIHVYGPKFSETIIATGKDLRSKKAEGFQFRFGGIVSGKALPVVPDDFGNGRTPDKISGVMIYVEKKPPILERNVGLVLDGELQEGVPYFGTPLRGGVRVYLDDRLVAYIKRQDLPETTKNAAGEPEWRLFDYLRSRGVDTSTVVEGWVVRQEKWQEKLARPELESIAFTAGAQAKGHLELGPQKVKAQSIILRSQPVTAAQIPAPDPEEL